MNFGYERIKRKKFVFKLDFLYENIFFCPAFFSVDLMGFVVILKRILEMDGKFK